MVDRLTVIERALDDAIKHLVAFGDRTPYPDDPRWSPWTRFQKPLIDKLVAARDEHRGAVEGARVLAEFAEWIRRDQSHPCPVDRERVDAAIAATLGAGS